MSRLKRLPLRTKILGMMLGACIVITLTALFLFERIIQKTEQGQLDLFGTYATGLAERIGAQFYERYGDVQAFALNEAMQTLKQDVISDVLNKYAALYGIYDLILFVDTNGRFIASNTKAPDGTSLKIDELVQTDFSRTPWFDAVMKGNFTEDKKKGFAGTFFEDPQVDQIVSKAYGKPMYGNGFSAPVRNGKGDVIGVLTARPGFRWVEHDFKLLYEELSAKGLETSEITLLDKRGNVLIDYDPHANNGDRNVKHDFEKVLLKLNLSENGVAAARAAVEGRSGAMLSLHARKQVMQAAGYAAIRSSKFIDSIGWSTIVRTSRDELFSQLSDARNFFFAAMTILFGLAAAIAYLFSSQLTNALRGLAKRLKAESSEVAEISGQIASSSTQLSEAATEQAASLQETVSSVDEINAMVTANAAKARRTREVSLSSRDAATSGKLAVDEMITAIEKISESSVQASQEMESNNLQILEVVKVIEEIGSKTKVIHDIVFQTKLLSFNASVEAARAGEHGKGFAVVAEEVGNLAQMSGNAAREIADMLSTSKSKVDDIVNHARQRISAMMQSNKDRVAAGTATATECGRALESILRNVTEANQLVDEMTRANDEQTLGIQEITKTINELDFVMQQNNAVAQQASNASRNLAHRSEGLDGVVTELLNVVGGSSTAQSLVEAPVAPVKPLRIAQKNHFDGTPSRELAPMELKKKRA